MCHMRPDQQLQCVMQPCWLRMQEHPISCIQHCMTPALIGKVEWCILICNPDAEQLGCSPPPAHASVGHVPLVLGRGSDALCLPAFQNPQDAF